VHVVWTLRAADPLAIAADRLWDVSYSTTVDSSIPPPRRDAEAGLSRLHLARTAPE
jgi:hypothetical protein